MQIDDSQLAGEIPSRKFPDVCLYGRRITLGAIIPSGIVLVLLLVELWQGENLLMLLLLAYVARILYGTLVAFFRPPQMAIRNGQFLFRFSQSRFLCPAADVADARCEGQSVRITLADVSEVEPDAARRQMERRSSRSCSILLPPKTYTLDQVNQLRHALGMPAQAADAAGEQLDEFQTSVKSHRPLVTATLIAACIAVYLVKSWYDRSFLGGTIESSIAWGANYGPLTLDGQWWRLVTHLFLHGGPFHILMNMWVLWDVGRLMERLVGHTAMAVIYFVAGIAGGMASLAFHPHIPSVGASGAVFGIIGALFGLLLHARDAVPPARLQQLQSGIIAFVIFNVIFGMSAQGVDVAAHAGGAIAGLLAGLIVLPAVRPGYWLRIGVLAIVGTGAFLLTGRLMPPAPRDFLVVLAQYDERAHQIRHEYISLEDKRAQGDLSDREFADQLEAKVVVPWRKLAADTREAIHETSGAKPGKFDQYLSVQQEAFEDTVAAVRGHDDQLYQKAEEKQAAAKKLATEINGENDDKP